MLVSSNVNLLMRNALHRGSQETGPHRVSQSVTPKQDSKHSTQAIQRPREALTPVDKKPSYTPYSLREYKATQPNEYYELGGLGAYNLGTDEWKKRKDQLDRRTEYARQVTDTMKAQPPPKPRRAERPSDEPISGRQKAIEFAKKIPRPKLKVKEHVQAVRPVNSLSELERLEQLHSNYESTVDAIKAAYA